MHADPVTTEIIRNAFVACAHDMNATLIRSAYSPIIYEGRDCAVAILDEDGNVLGQSLGVPLFLGNLELCIKLTAELLGWEAFGPGDVFYMNDAYMTGTHLNDATIFGPIYWDDRLVGFSATRAHWVDVGAKDPAAPTDASEIYQEGMRWGPTRLHAAGQPREDIIDLLRRNSRFGRAIVGDMNAQIAACRTGEARFQAILERFGYGTYASARQEIYRQSEVLEREAVSALADGTYQAEGVLDDDGLGNGPVPVRVRIDVSGDTMAIDLEGTSPATPGPINCGFAQTVSACRVAFKLLIHPGRPVDGGTFKTLEVTAPEKSILAAEEPASCRWYFTPCGLLIDLIVKALAPALPNAVAGAHYGDSMVSYFAGTDPRRGDAPFLYGVPHPGGWGGYEGGDGEDGLINMVNGAVKDIPIEVFEQKFPGLVREYVFRPDTGGAGRFRGGCGVSRVYEWEAPSKAYFWFERSVTPAWGLFGGTTAAGPDVIVNPGREDERHLLKANAFPIRTGDVVEVRTGGGGGFGRPRERDPQLVRLDVLDGFVSHEAAEREYGVVVDDSGIVDVEATNDARSR
jgi:N-methylhydantoinase B